MGNASQLIKAAAVGECLGGQSVRWQADAFEVAFEGRLPTLFEDWPHRIRRLPPNFRRRLRQPRLYGWQTQLLLLHGLTDSSPDVDTFQRILIGGFEQRAWRGQTHSFVRAIHQLRRVEEQGPTAAGAFDLGLVICGALPRLYGERMRPWLGVLGRIERQVQPYMQLLDFCLHRTSHEGLIEDVCTVAVPRFFDGAD
ncbi:MAG: hypothetical protein VX589_14155, partial [Myxococcota bacterium]|nr:hypothetical protein [Myxococcota bacterium]